MRNAHVQNRRALGVVAVVIGLMFVKWPLGLVGELVALFVWAIASGLMGLRSPHFLNNSRLFLKNRELAWQMLCMGLGGLGCLGWIIALHLLNPLPR